MASEPELDTRCDALIVKQRRLAVCMQKLREKQRNLLKLYYYDRKDSYCIADETGAEAPAVRKALQRIRGALRACIDAQPAV
jgi:DNA-directed RNA polymerase specialized sigma24 family protein